MTSKEIPIDTRLLFKPLQSKLIYLLKSLNEDDWKNKRLQRTGRLRI